jgi:hypothetical protein
MARVAKSTDELVEQLTAEVRAEILASIRPLLQSLGEAAAGIESALAAGKIAARGGRRRGRPPKSPSAVKSTTARRSKGGKLPRGSMRKAIIQVFQGASGPVTLAALRNGVMEQAGYKRRDPKSLYTQIVGSIPKIPGVAKTAKGEYVYKGK